jgi:hypothetical protein
MARAKEFESTADDSYPMWMRFLLLALAAAACGVAAPLWAGETFVDLPADPGQSLERTCFQTGGSYSDTANLRSDVAIVYGIDPKLPERIQTWRDRGYRIHVMTGVSWGHYQDYLYGRFDGVNHEDEAQTERNGKKISHGGDVYYMCPGTNYGKFLAVGVQRALDAGAEAIHLEEPEFWVRGGYEEGFKREWKSYYNEDWLAPHSSPDAQWRASKLKYFLYRRALQQVFDHVTAFNKRTGKHVRCYVPTHSLINYAHWRIVSPESSLARLNGCDGYIAQVWTGTARTPNVYQGKLKERTFETAFLEYGAMQNLVRSTGRGVWYLNDPIEDNPRHDWNDYQRNWESTLVASLFQPEVWQYEVAPWPERIFTGRYPHGSKEATAIPPAYATELQVVFNALNDMKQARVEWDGAAAGIGVIVSDSLMFQRGENESSDPHMSHLYGLAMPFLKRGMPITPVQLENVTVPKYLNSFRFLMLSYHGQKPLSPDVHEPLAQWVRNGGVLMVVDDDSDPYNQIREWWNSDGLKFATPREHLFKVLDAKPKEGGELLAIGKGALCFIRRNPAAMAQNVSEETLLMQSFRMATRYKAAVAQEANYLKLRRGPYIIAAGLDESIEDDSKVIEGRYISLFDPELRLRRKISIDPGTRHFLVDLDFKSKGVIASGCKVLPGQENSYVVEGIANTPGIVLLRADKAPKNITLGGEPLKSFEFSGADGLLWIKFPNAARARELRVNF